MTKSFVESDPLEYFISNQGTNISTADVWKYKVILEWGKNLNESWLEECSMNSRTPPHRQAYNCTTFQEYQMISRWFGPLENRAINLQKLIAAKKLERLENLECINQYAKEFQQRGRLFLVVDNSSLPAILNPVGCGDNTTGDGANTRWVCCGASTYLKDSSINNEDIPCEFTEAIDKIRLNVSKWAPGTGEERIAYCLSEETPSMCKIFASVDLAVVVIIFNSIKAAAMFAVAKWVEDSPLMNIGDAVASFVSKQDLFTKGMPPVSREEVASWGKWELCASKFEGERQPVYTAVGKRLWILIYSL